MTDPKEPVSIPATEQTWHAVIEAPKPHRVLGSRFETSPPFCEGVCLLVNGRPSRVDRVVETDSGVYPPSIEQAHLIAKAPELYREVAEQLRRARKRLPVQADDTIPRMERLLAEARGEKPK